MLCERHGTRREHEREPGPYLIYEMNSLFQHAFWRAKSKCPALFVDVFKRARETHICDFDRTTRKRGCYRFDVVVNHAVLFQVRARRHPKVTWRSTASSRTPPASTTLQRTTVHNLAHIVNTPGNDPRTLRKMKQYGHVTTPVSL